MSRSFRAQLALRFTATMALGVIAISAASLLTLRAALDRELEASILNVASIQAASVTSAPEGRMEFHEWELTPEEAASVQELVRYAQVWNAEGRSLLRSPHMTADLPLDTEALRTAAAGEIIWTEGSYGGARVRSLYYPLERLGEAHERHVLQVAASLEARNQMVARLAVFFGALSLLVILGSAAGSWWLAGKAVRPVHEIIDQAEAVEAGSLERRIDAYAEYPEYERLVQVLNHMLARLERSFETQRRFTADASHELRSPLTAMRGELELALRRERDPEEYRRVLASTLEEVIRLGRITENLLTLARSDSGEIRPRPELLDLGELVRGVVERMRSRADAKEIGVSVETEGDTEGRYDPGLLTQVVWNLLDNAVKFTPRGGRVTAVLRRSGDTIRIEVSDTGPGLGDGPPDRIFRRFYQQDEARSYEPGASGTGLGLAIVRAVVEAHGGRVAAENRTEGGARLILVLPVTDQARGTASRAGRETPSAPALERTSSS